MMVHARSGSWGTALLTGESRLGAGAGELAQRELDHGQQRLWRVGAKPAPHGDPCRRGDRSGENLRPERELGIPDQVRMQSFIRYLPDLDLIAASRIPVALAAGMDTIALAERADLRHDPFHRPCTAIAARLGAEFAEFPGGHLAPMELPAPFAAGLRDVFGRL